MAVHKSFRIIGIVINYSSLPKADPWFQSFVWIWPYIFNPFGFQGDKIFVISRMGDHIVVFYFKVVFIIRCRGTWRSPGLRRCRV
jgi:hypothetical protein